MCFAPSEHLVYVVRLFLSYSMFLLANLPCGRRVFFSVIFFSVLDPSMSSVPLSLTSSHGVLPLDDALRAISDEFGNLLLGSLSLPLDDTLLAISDEPAALLVGPMLVDGAAVCPGSCVILAFLVAFVFGPSKLKPLQFLQPAQFLQFCEDTLVNISIVKRMPPRDLLGKLPCSHNIPCPGS